MLRTSLRAYRIHDEALVQMRHMSSPNSLQIEVTKVSKHKGKPVTMFFRIRRDEDAREHPHIPKSWIHGAIRLDMTKIFSASFQKWHKLRYDESEQQYTFKHLGGEFSVTGEVIAQADKINTEHFLLNRIP